jgi:hypothetical protein
MKQLLKIFIIFGLIITTFFVGERLTYAIQVNDDTAACFICSPSYGATATRYYSWVMDGSNPNPNNCSKASSITTRSKCTGTPTADTDTGSGSGSDSGSGSTTDDETYEDYEDSDGPDISGPSTSSGCSGIIGSGNFRMYLTDILNAMRIVGVAMVIIFSTIDFAKALITQDNDAMKKASEKSMKRLILAMVIFFTPILLNILLSLVGIDASCI